MAVYNEKHFFSPVLANFRLLFCDLAKSGIVGQTTSTEISKKSWNGQKTVVTLHRQKEIKPHDREQVNIQNNNSINN